MVRCIASCWPRNRVSVEVSYTPALVLLSHPSVWKCHCEKESEVRSDKDSEEEKTYRIHVVFGVKRALEPHVLRNALAPPLQSPWGLLEKPEGSPQDERGGELPVPRVHVVGLPVRPGLDVRKVLAEHLKGLGVQPQSCIGGQVGEQAAAGLLAAGPLGRRDSRRGLRHEEARTEQVVAPVPKAPLLIKPPLTGREGGEAPDLAEIQGPEAAAALQKVLHVVHGAAPHPGAPKLHGGHLLEVLAVEFRGRLWLLLDDRVLSHTRPGLALSEVLRGSCIRPAGRSTAEGPPHAAKPGQSDRLTRQQHLVAHVPWPSRGPPGAHAGSAELVHPQVPRCDGLSIDRRIDSSLWVFWVGLLPRGSKVSASSATSQRRVATTAVFQPVVQLVGNSLTSCSPGFL